MKTEMLVAIEDAALETVAGGSYDYSKYAEKFKLDLDLDFDFDFNTQTNTANVVGNHIAGPVVIEQTNVNQ